MHVQTSTRPRRRTGRAGLAARLRSPKRDHHKTERAHDSPRGIGRVHAAGERTRVAVSRTRGCKGQWKTHAPQRGCREDRHETAQQIQLKSHGNGSARRPVGEQLRERVSGPGYRADEEELTPSQRELGIAFAASKSGARAAAHAESDEENAQDDRKRIHGRAHHQRQQARPDHLRAEGTRAGNRDGDIDAPGVCDPQIARGARPLRRIRRGAPSHTR